jgi:septal ring factor EnvC (AmiA/AmiB activator)
MITSPMTDGRLADTARRRERLLTAINTAAGSGEISVSGIARAAGVHRTFLYRHPDLLQLVHAAQTTPAPPREADASDAVSLASLRADLANSRGRAARQDARIQQLERKLAGFLGDQVWAESGLGGGEDIQQLQRQITFLEQRLADLTAELDERTQDLEAARATNRELMAQLNSPSRGHQPTQDHCR